MIRTALRRMRSEESGLSLIELLVSGLLTVCIMVMIGSMFVQTAKLTTQSTQTSRSNAVASNIANEVTSVLRVATTLPKSGQILPEPAILSGDAETLTLYSFSNTDPNNPAPVRIKFTISSLPDRNVIEERCTATSSGGFWTFGACASLTTRNLGGIVQPIGGSVVIPGVVSEQFFTYYQANGTPILITPTSPSTDRAKVSSIRVYVSVKAPGSTTNKAVISNTVVMGNLGLENSES
jgi:Tfp pilus assembly protein PilV